MSPRSINRHLTLRLRQLRNRAGLTQAELAAELNVNRKTVSHYETGERTPDVHMIAALARFFRVSADYLLGLTDVPLPTTEILHLLALQNQQAERPLRVAEDE